MFRLLELIERSKALDNFYSEEAIQHAGQVIEFVRARMAEKNRIESALKDWALELGPRSPEVLAIGCFGSCARGDWGVGSDLDLLLVVDQSDAPFERRASRLRTESLPVPVDPLVYTRREITDMFERGGRFPEMLRRELRWVWKREGSPELAV